MGAQYAALRTMANRFQRHFSDVPTSKSIGRGAESATCFSLNVLFCPLFRLKDKWIGSGTFSGRIQGYVSDIYEKNLVTAHGL